MTGGLWIFSEEGVINFVVLLTPFHLFVQCDSCSEGLVVSNHGLIFKLPEVLQDPFLVGCELTKVVGVVEYTCLYIFYTKV